jgi:hypothetical protein
MCAPHIARLYGTPAPLQCIVGGEAVEGPHLIVRQQQRQQQQQTASKGASESPGRWSTSLDLLELCGEAIDAPRASCADFDDDGDLDCLIRWRRALSLCLFVCFQN